MGVAMLLISLLLAVFIIVYYWQNRSLESMAYVPVYVMILSFGYVVAQIVKRSVIKKQFWWDWLYYIGLIAIVTPTFFANAANVKMFEWTTDYGTLFLVIPLILDGKKLLITK